MKTTLFATLDPSMLNVFVAYIYRERNVEDIVEGGKVYETSRREGKSGPSEWAHLKVSKAQLVQQEVELRISR